MLIWAATITLAYIVYLFITFWLSKATSIPTAPGLPILGNAIALGKGGLAYISQCRQRFGDVFCLRVLGQRMVFVFDPAMLTLFLKAPDSSISFKPAVEQFTQRIYGLPSSEFFSRHEDLLATLRGLLVPAQLQELGRDLIQYALPQLQQWQQEGKVDLWTACQTLVFSSAGQVLFGPAFFKRHGLAAVQAAFLEFEGNFEVAASPIPHLFLPGFRRSRKTLLAMLSASLAAGDFEGTVVVQLLQGCGLRQDLWPNLLLAVLWASQANSMPAMFWSLALLLLPEHAAARHKLLQELQDTIQQQQQPANLPTQTEAKRQQQPQQQQPGAVAIDKATEAAMLQVALDKRSWASRCVAEAIRLRLHSIAVRFVSVNNLVLTPSSSSSSSGGMHLRQPGNIAAAGLSSTGTKCPTPPAAAAAAAAGLHVPRGSILCICPMESHHDPRLYPDEPWAFKPDREFIQGLGPGTVVPGVAGLGFGGGFWRCPGRFFAEMELALLLQLVLLQLHLEPELRSSSQHQQCNNQQHQQCNSQQQQQGSQQQQGIQQQQCSSQPQQCNSQQQQCSSQPQQPSSQQQQQEGLQPENGMWKTPAEVQAAAEKRSIHPRHPRGLLSVLGLLLPAGVRDWVYGVAEFGLGCCGGSGLQEQQWALSGVAAGGSGMQGGGGGSGGGVCLPRCELRRLVGFKVPAEPWWVRVGPTVVPSACS